jgi:uncharacterized RDD family membrane protein YckC
MPYGQASPFGYQPAPVDRFGRPLAEWWQRLLGIVIDWLILSVPKFVVTLFVAGATDGGNVFSVGWGAGLVVVGILFAVIDLGYFGILNGGEKGQTVGQMALGIKVRDEATGGAVGPQRAGVRILILWPGILIGWVPILGSLTLLYTLVAAFSPLWDRRRQGLHDKVAHTDVIKVR